LKKRSVKISLKDSLDLFINRCESKNLSLSTIRFYKDNIDRYIKYLYTDHNIQNPLAKDFNAQLINKYLSKAKNSIRWENHSYIKTKKEKLASQSLRTYTRALRAFGNWLFKEGLIKENILETVVLPKATEKDKEILTDDEIKTIINSFEIKTELGLRNSIIFFLSCDAGIREGGIANLKIGDVDFKAKTVRVRLKGGNITILPIGNIVIFQIKEYIVKYRGIDNKNEPLLTNRDGSKLTENAIKKMFYKIKIKTGIEKLNCHLGRHTFATNYLDAGHTQRDLQFALAHESEAMSKKYVHLAEKINNVRRGADSHLDKILNNSKKGCKGVANIKQ